jgi:hypothetical protein
MQLEKTVGPFLHNIISSLRLRYHKYHFTALLMWPFKVSIFFKSISTSLFTGGTFYSNLDIFHEYLMQQSLKLGGTYYHFKWVVAPGTSPHWKARALNYDSFLRNLIYVLCTVMSTYKQCLVRYSRFMLICMSCFCLESSVN